MFGTLELNRRSQHLRSVLFRVYRILSKLSCSSSSTLIADYNFEMYRTQFLEDSSGILRTKSALESTYRFLKPQFRHTSGEKRQEQNFSWPNRLVSKGYGVRGHISNSNIKLAISNVLNFGK